MLVRVRVSSQTVLGNIMVIEDGNKNTLSNVSKADTAV